MKLSDRLRPDCEAAPWVIEEVLKLEAEVEQLKTNWSNCSRACAKMQDKAAKADADVRRLREALETIRDAPMDRWQWDCVIAREALE